MKVLLLGGTGAMGVALAPILLERGDEVCITTRKRRTSDKDNLTYIQGDAHSTDFITETLKIGFDAVIDFMSYTTDEFKARVELLLSNTKQYIFLSSSRVYNNSPAINENSPRLLDSLHDEEYLKTDEYALAKAREENLLFQSGRNNWTIIRPYVTYNNDRLQLTILEKDMWLDRVLRGKRIIYFDQFSPHETTMTHGQDVARLMSLVIGNPKAYGNAYHVTTSEHHNWKYVFNQYCSDIEEITGHKPEVVISRSDRDLNSFGSISGRTWQIKYDRLFDREFDNTKILSCAGQANFSFISAQDGYKCCIDHYFSKCQKNPAAYQITDYRVEGFLDRFTKDREQVFHINGIKNKVKYVLFRYFPISVCEILNSYLFNRRKK